MSDYGDNDNMPKEESRVRPPLAPFVTRITNDQNSLIDQLCLFAYSLLPPSSFSRAVKIDRHQEEEEEHLFSSASSSAPIFYSRIAFLLNKENKIYKSKYLSEYGKPMYSLYPQTGSRFEIPYRRKTLGFTFYNQDHNHLYAYIDKYVYESCYHLHVDAPSQNDFEDFLKEAIEFSNHFLLDEDNNAQKITIFHYTDYWDKFQDISIRLSSTIYLPHQQTESLMSDIRRFVDPSTREIYNRFGIPYRRNYCFYGPPGTGKTSLIQSIASELKRDISIIRFHPDFTDRNFSKAIQWMPKKSLLVLEDIDSLLPNSSRLNVSMTYSGLLNIMDGFSGMDGMLIFITTNHIQAIDGALLREGRIHYRLEFRYIHRDQIELMVRSFYPDEMDCVPFLIEAVRGLPFTVCHMQAFFFSIYPKGNIRSSWEQWFNDFRKRESFSVLSSSTLYT